MTWEARGHFLSSESVVVFRSFILSRSKINNRPSFFATLPHASILSLTPCRHPSAIRLIRLWITNYLAWLARRGFPNLIGRCHHISVELFELFEGSTRQRHRNVEHITTLALMNSRAVRHQWSENFRGSDRISRQGTNLRHSPRLLNPPISSNFGLPVTGQEFWRSDVLYRFMYFSVRTR